MRLREHRDAASFIEALRPLWEPRESELNLILGVGCAIRDGRWSPPSPPLFATLESDGVHAAVMRTPPSGFIVAEGAPGAAAELARAIAASGDHRNAPSVIASSRAARAFAEAWSRETGRAASLRMGQRILELERVLAPRAAPGRFRAANPHDGEQLTDWILAGEVEASPDPPAPREEMALRIERQIEAQTLFVWEIEAGLVSVAALVRPTPNGVAVSAVYTPPAQRGRGYASCCVAALSQHALDSGKRFTCLYTDAANPTSNAIYERLGYALVSESEQWSFAPSV